MSIALSITERKSGTVLRYVPMVGQKTYKNEWLPVLKTLGLSMLATAEEEGIWIEGGDVPGGNLTRLINEVLTLERWLHDNQPQRIDEQHILKQVRAALDEYGTDPSVVLSIG